MADKKSKIETTPRQKTRTVQVGDVVIGGGHPIAVQSMLCASETDPGANIEQVNRLSEAGCEIARMAVPRRESLAVFSKVCDASPIPIVADIHFDAKCAIEAAWRGASALRINPGNIGGLSETDLVIAAARGAGIPIRIGVNAGSLQSDIASRSDMTLPEKLAKSAVDYVRYFKEERGFTNIVVSAKAHDVLTTVETYRLLAQRIPDVPLHIGVTEAGGAMQGLVKSSAGLGILLAEGIGDTLRISLTDDPVLEVRGGWALLSALQLRQRTPEIISCPTCSRCKVDLISIAKEVEERLSTYEMPIKVAVMGCVVNGPGEAKDADVGVACGDSHGAVFAHGKIVRKVKEGHIVDALMEQIEAL